MPEAGMPEAGRGPAGDARPGPLGGVRVLEFSQIVAAPVAGMNLADLGADVIKVEPPGGEAARRLGAVLPPESKGYQALNRGKRGLVIDLHDPRGVGAIRQIVRDIDVVLINYRLGVAERLGIDYESLCQVRPDLIYWQNTGFGESGPDAYRAGSDIVAQAYSGLMALDGKTTGDGAPDLISSPVSDIMSGFAAAMGISAALYHRALTGEGQRLGTSLLRTSLFMMGASVMREPVHDAVLRDRMLEDVRAVRKRGGSYGEILEARGTLEAQRSAFRLYYGGYRARDGGVVLGALTPANRDQMRRVLGAEAENSDSEGYDSYDPESQRQAVRWKQHFRELFLKKSALEWVRLFDEAGVPVAPVHLPEEMSENEQVLADGMITEQVHTVSGPQRLVSPAVTMSATPTRVQRAAPALGEHSAEVLIEAGLTPDAVAELVAAGVIFERQGESAPTHSSP